MTNEMVIIGAVALGSAVLAALAGIAYAVDFLVALRHAKPSTRP